MQANPELDEDAEVEYGKARGGKDTVLDFPRGVVLSFKLGEGVDIATVRAALTSACLVLNGESPHENHLYKAAAQFLERRSGPLLNAIGYTSQAHCGAELLRHVIGHGLCWMGYESTRRLVEASPVIEHVSWFQWPQPASGCVETNSSFLTVAL